MNEKIKSMMDTIDADGAHPEFLDKNITLEKRKEVLLEALLQTGLKQIASGITEDSVNAAISGATTEELVKRYGESAEMLGAEETREMLKAGTIDSDVMAGMMRGMSEVIARKECIKVVENPETWVAVNKYSEEHPDTTPKEVTVPQAAVAEVLAVAETTVSDIHIPTMEEMSADNERISSIYTSSNTGGGGGSSSGEISALGWLGIAAVGAAALYGGYHLWNSDETEDTLVVDIDEAF